MIVYKDVMKTLLDHGWSQYKLQKSGIIGSGTIARINAGKSISTDTIDKMCKLCECQPGDLIYYVPDDWIDEMAGSK